jgi:hypothetical protein
MSRLRKSYARCPADIGQLTDGYTSHSNGFLPFSRRSAGSISSSIQSATRTSGRVSTRKLSRALTSLAI